MRHVEAAGGDGIEGFGAQHVTACLAHAHGAHHIGADHRRYQPQAHLGEAEAGVVAGQHYVTGTEQAERSGDYGRVAELRYGKIQEAEAKLKELQEQVHQMQGENIAGAILEGKANAVNEVVAAAAANAGDDEFVEVNEAV